MHTRKAITEAIRKLGVQTGDLLMVHASLKAIGPVEEERRRSLPRYAPRLGRLAL
ncbi:aac(3)-IIa_1_X51534 [Klebsiella pneumoniae]|nr:aac(3)-IIa_1_X51534 [Klebsiella pneumoniae]